MIDIEKNTNPTLDTMISERDKIRFSKKEHIDRKNTNYACFICKKQDVKWDTVLNFSYVIDNNGSITRFGHAYTDLKLCSEECRKKCVPLYYDSYERFMEGVNIPKLFNQSRLSFIHSERTKSYYESYLNGLSSINKGLYLVGNIGCGKTYAACSIAYELRKRDKTVFFVSAHELILRANNIAYNNREIDEFLYKYSKYDYLIIDDMDNLTAINTNAKSILFMLFSKIYNEDKKLIITSNFKIEEVFNHIDERITSRMNQILLKLPILDEDKRLTNESE